RFNEEDQIILNPKGGDKRSILTAEHKNFLSECIDEDPSITIADLTKKLTDKFPKLSLTVISHKCNTPGTIMEREKYVKKIYEESIDMYEAIYIDETGFNLHLSSSRAITKDRVLKCSSYLELANANIFSKFIEDLISLIPADTKKLLVMDNAPIHCAYIVQNIVEDSLYEIFFLSPYSLFLNLIENIFFKVKGLVAENQFRDCETILSRIDDAFDAVSVEDCIEWI
ncbi:23251_t:CDS:2, partial [Dentiscutata erythropus]